MRKKLKKHITLDELALLMQQEFLGVRNTINEFRREIEKRFDEVEKRLLRLETGSENLRTEVREIKYLLQQKASREELNDLDMRLTKVEMRLKKLSV